MKNFGHGSKTTALHRGELEAAGLGEVAYFLKKAKQQIDHARFALQNVDFSRSTEMLADAAARVTAMDKLIIEMKTDLDKAEQAALSEAEEKEESEEQ